MRRISEHNLARRITAREGLRESLSIAQVKEVLRITLDELAVELDYNTAGVLDLIAKHRKRVRE